MIERLVTTESGIKRRGGGSNRKKNNKNNKDVEREEGYVWRKAEVAWQLSCILNFFSFLY